MVEVMIDGCVSLNDKTVGVQMATRDGKLFVAFSAESLALMLAACVQVCGAVEVDETSHKIEIEGDALIAASKLARGVVQAIVKENGEQAVGDMAVMVMMALEKNHPTRRDAENTRPPSEEKADLALARDLGMDLTKDPANGGPGGGMGDAAAAMPAPGELRPVPGVTRGNELNSKPVMRLWTPGDN